MSAEPSPCSMSPSRRGTSLPLAGHGVEVAAEDDPPVAAELGARDHVVADAVEGRARRTLAAGGARRARRARASWRLTDGTADERRGRAEQVAASAQRRPRRHVADAVVAQDVVELGLVVALALLEPPEDQRARQTELAAGERPAAGSPARRCTTAARRPGSTSSPVSASITGIAGLRITPSPSTHAVADARALRRPCSGCPIVHVVADDDRRRLRRLEHAADADAAREVHALADLRARPDRRPGVDHRVGADARADVHVARHQDRRRARGTSPSGPTPPGTTRTRAAA